MRVSLLYFDGCPNWQVAREHLQIALEAVGAGGTAVERVEVDTPERAAEMRFRGSPTIVIDGVDPFAGDSPASFGLSCRVYRTPAGLAGAPSVEQLVDALRAASG